MKMFSCHLYVTATIRDNWKNSSSFLIFNFFHDFLRTFGYIARFVKISPIVFSDGTNFIAGRFLIQLGNWLDKGIGAISIML